MNTSTHFWTSSLPAPLGGLSFILWMKAIMGMQAWGKEAFHLAASTFRFASVTFLANSHPHVILLPLIWGKSIDIPGKEESDGCCLPGRAVANPHHAFVWIRNRCPFCGAGAPLCSRGGAGVSPQPFSWAPSAHALPWLPAHRGSWATPAGLPWLFKNLWG